MKTHILALALALATGAIAPAFAVENATLTVTLAPPETADWPVTLQANGRLQAWSEAVISAETGGLRIKEVLADVGSVVKKGDIIALLATESLQNTITQQEAAVLSAEAGYRKAKADADRARSLTEGQSGALSSQAATEYYVAEEQAEADLASAKAALASSRLDLDHATIRAPDDGVISAREAALGAVVSQGSELFRLIRQSRIEWQAEVPARALRDIQPGTKAEIPTPFGAVPGEVRLIAPTVSETTGRVIVYVSLTPPEGAPMPRTGLMVQGTFQTGLTPALSVPATAVSMRDGFSYVFTLDQGDAVTRHKVETGRRQGERVEILSGLEAGAKVVQAGGAFLNDGSLVEVAQ
jgi:RND family efflux transporter MFP subunit